MHETDHLAGHLKDLAEQSYERQIYTFTNFLGEAEQGVLLSVEKEIGYAGVTLFGGTDNADRCIARFGRPDELGYEQPFPIICLKADPAALKYSEQLTHRDYLGALMGLGVERELIGDIYLDGLSAYIFCIEHIAGFVAENLVQVRHTNVRLSVMDEVPECAGPGLEECILVTASERLDAVISKMFNLSRNKSLILFQNEKVFVNGRECRSCSTICRPGDKVSVRGFGKFIYDGMEGITGKGRCRVKTRVYR